MANWYGLGRTNYVRVRDRAALDAWIDEIGVSVEIADKGDLVALIGDDDSGDLPYWWEDEAGEEHDDFIGDFVAKHLRPDDVLIYMSVGHEKARYGTGVAVAYKIDQEPVSINLDDIYAHAAAAFDVEARSITQAAY